MADLEKLFLSDIDNDIFLILKYDEESLLLILEKINNIHPTIKLQIGFIVSSNIDEVIRSVYLLFFFTIRFYKHK